jgi:hypothetical protein
MPKTSSTTPVVASVGPAVVLPLVWAGSLVAVPLRIVLLVDRVVNRPSAPPAVRPARLTFVGTGRREGEDS